MSQKHVDLTQVTPPTDLPEAERLAIVQHVFRRLASHRNKAEMYAAAEYALSSRNEQEKIFIRNTYVLEISRWAQELVNHTWTACQEPGGGKQHSCQSIYYSFDSFEYVTQGKCPTLSALSDTSTADLPKLPKQDHVNQVLQTVLFLHLTTSHGYNAHTRTFLYKFGDVNESAVVATLKNPERAVQEAERKARTQSAKDEQATRNTTLRKVGMGLAAVGGGVLIGVTGGLAAPLVGAGVTTVLGWLGVGGTAAGLLASGLAGSSVVCGALFGAYGSKKSAEMVGRFTREVQDLAIEPVFPPRETLAVRLCVSGWLDSPDDVTAPWTIFGGDDTFALRWVWC
jgi:hypothetical protein